MITIRADWTLEVPEEERGIGWAGENEVERRVFVLPEGYGEDWVYRLDLRLADGSADIVLLEPEEGTLTWEITARHLDPRGAKNGYVYAQIRADKGERVKKSSVAQFRVTRSIEASGTVEVNPSEIEQAEERMNALLLGAQEAEAGAEEAQSAAAGSAAQAQAAQAAAESAREAAETARDEAEDAAGQTAADREAAGKDRAEVEKLAEQAAADAAQVAADKGTVAGDKLAADEAKTDAEAARDEAQRQAGLAAGSADEAAEAIAAFTDTTLPDAVEQVTEAGAAQAALAEAAADRAEAAAERAEGIDGWTKEEADDRFANALKGSASGELVRLEDVSPSGALTRAAVLGETIETGTGDKGPDNPYTLSGAKPAALTVCGRNLFDIDNPLYAARAAEQLTRYPKIENGVLYSGGEAGNSAGVSICVKAVGAGSYSVTAEASGESGFAEISGFDSIEDNLMIGYKSIKTVAVSAGSLSFTIECEQAYFGIAFYSNTRYGIALRNIQIESGTATPYEPYAGQSVSLPEGLELYGADGVSDEYDAASGTLTRRLAVKVLNGKETWTRHLNSDVNPHGITTYYCVVDGSYDNGVFANTLPCRCSHYAILEGQSAATADRNGITFSTPWADKRAIYIYSTESSVEEFKTFLAGQSAAGTPVTVVYLLAEPAAEEPGEPTRIAPPAPVCQVYADAREAAVVYNRDVNAAMAGMDKRIAALEEALATLLMDN